MNEDKAQPAQIKLSRDFLQRFDPATIQQFISSEKARDKKFRDEIVGILKVFYIIKKIEDYGRARKVVA